MGNMLTLFVLKHIQMLLVKHNTSKAVVFPRRKQRKHFLNKDYLTAWKKRYNYWGFYLFCFFAWNSMSIENPFSISFYRKLDCSDSLELLWKSLNASVNRTITMKFFSSFPHWKFAIQFILPLYQLIISLLLYLFLWKHIFSFSTVTINCWNVWKIGESNQSTLEARQSFIFSHGFFYVYPVILLVFKRSQKDRESTSTIFLSLSSVLTIKTQFLQLEQPPEVFPLSSRLIMSNKKVFYDGERRKKNERQIKLSDFVFHSGECLFSLDYNSNFHSTSWSR